MRLLIGIFLSFLVNFIGGYYMEYVDAQTSGIILITNPKILAVNIVDNKEVMINLTHQKDLIYGPSPEIPDNTDYIKIRKTVYEKLKQAQTLLPKGLHFCLYEGYRSLHLQKMLFHNRLEKVERQHPTWTEEQIFLETTKLVSPVVNWDGSKNVPPHSTGGAVDLYLIDDEGQPVDMGIHPKDWITDDDGSISLTSSTIISKKAQKNRKIMSHVLSKVGFVNYPTEYWHWSYGDRYWAYHTHHPHAIYNSYEENTAKWENANAKIF